MPRLKRMELRLMLRKVCDGSTVLCFSFSVRCSENASNRRLVFLRKINKEIDK